MNTLTRRDLLRTAGVLGGGAALAYLFPPSSARGYALLRQAPDPVAAAAAARAGTAKTPIEVTKLTDTLTMLSGPGGNVVVLNGPDGKVVVDTFVQARVGQLKQRLDAHGQRADQVAVIDTHWHFDHADNNENFREAGAESSRTRTRRSGCRRPTTCSACTSRPSPAGALPTQTFAASSHDRARTATRSISATSRRRTPTPTSTSTSRRRTCCTWAIVFFNGMYPFIDASTGGNINGMIAAADRGAEAGRRRRTQDRARPWTAGRSGRAHAGIATCWSRCATACRS